jgi:hypothetical protein
MNIQRSDYVVGSKVDFYTDLTHPMHTDRLDILALSRQSEVEWEASRSKKSVKRPSMCINYQIR